MTRDEWYPGSGWTRWAWSQAPSSATSTPMVAPSLYWPATGGRFGYLSGGTVGFRRSPASSGSERGPAGGPAWHWVRGVGGSVSGDHPRARARSVDRLVDRRDIGRCGW